MESQEKSAQERLSYDKSTFQVKKNQDNTCRVKECQARSVKRNQDIVKLGEAESREIKSKQES